MQTFLEMELLNNPGRSWLLAAATAVAAYFGLILARRLVLRYMGAVARHTRNQADDLVQNVLAQTKVFFLLFVSLYAATRVLVLTADLAQTLRIIGVIIVTLQVAIWGNVLISGLIQRQAERRMADDPGSATTLSALGFVARLILWTVLLLMALDNLGFNVTTLIAGLGVGGIAVALAVQNILGDLFASLSIVLDKPFVTGDFIIVDDKLGTVEKVGLKTTRVRALSGEQIVFANNDLLNARVQNYKRMFERRAVFMIRVAYQTPRARIREIPGIIREAVEAQELARFDRSHFFRYGEYSLDFETVYYVKVPDYNDYMDVQQAINLHIHEAFESADIEFAISTQRLVMEQGAEQRLERR